MDRLVSVEPEEVNLELEDDDGASSATVHLKNVLHTMPVAFKVEPTIPNKYVVKPATGMLSPLETVTLQISLMPLASPNLKRFSVDSFEVKSVVVASGLSKSKDLFASRKRMVFTEENLKVAVVGGLVLRNAVVRGALEDATQVLDRAAAFGNIPVVVEGRNAQGLTALHLAVETRRAEMVQLLLDFGARVDVKSRDARGQTVLHEAAKSGQTVVSEILLARGASRESEDAAGWRPIHHAVSNGHMELLRLLLSSKCDLNAPIGDGRTALHLAVISGDTDCIQVLLQNGADVGARTVGGKTALHLAATQGHNVAIAKFLLAWGASRDAVDWQGRTAYDEAVELGQESLFKLLEVGALEESLRSAAWSGDVKGVRKCLRRGANVNSRDQFGWTALHCAAFKGHCEVVKRLIWEGGADVKAVDEQGYTSLHCAVECGQKEVVKVLLQVDETSWLNSRTVKGMTALDMALSLKLGSISRLLMNAGAQRPSLSTNLILESDM